MSSFHGCRHFMLLVIDNFVSITAHHVDRHCRFKLETLKSLPQMMKWGKSCTKEVKNQSMNRRISKIMKKWRSWCAISVTTDHFQQHQRHWLAAILLATSRLTWIASTTWHSIRLETSGKRPNVGHCNRVAFRKRTIFVFKSFSVSFPLSCFYHSNHSSLSTLNIILF